MNSDDEKWMEQTYDIAQKAMDKGEVPVGCLIVYKGEVVGRGGNFSNEGKSAIKHAEFLAMEEAKIFASQKNISSFTLFAKSTLYVTLEPCIM